MAIIRHEVQQYANPAALVAEVNQPTNNDEVHIESLNRRFNWLEGSSTAADDVYVIDQTSETANGRWAATAVAGAKVFTGSATTGAIPNGNTAVFDVTLDDGAASVLLADSGAALGITNGGTFPTNVFLDSIVLTADNTVQVTVVNESGVDVPAFTVDVKAIDYTGAAFAGGGAAAAAPAKKIEFGSVVNDNNNEVAITFATPFTSAPFVVLTAISDGSTMSDFFASSPTTTGFTLKRGIMFSMGSLVDIAWKAEEK